MARRRMRLRDLFAGRTEAESDHPPDGHTELIDAAADGADVEGALRECRRGNAETWDRIEHELKRERRVE